MIASVKNTLVAIIMAVTLSVVGSADDSTDKHYEKLMSNIMVPEPPPGKIPPAAGAAMAVNVVYLSNGTTFHLAEGVFYRLLYDTPKAVVFKCKAQLLASDDRFYYFHDERFDYEWAFSIDPRDNFANHSIWSRKHGQVEWRLQSGEAVMANSK